MGFAVLGTALVGLAGWITLRNLSRSGTDGWIFWAPIALWLLTMALLCCAEVLAADGPGDSRARISASWRMGWLIGGLGLALGFLGPLVVTPKANLGPLLGILLTGPLGFVIGAISGALIRPRGTGR